MAVQYYNNEFGLVSVVKGDAEFAAISALGTGLNEIVNAGVMTTFGESFFDVFPSPAVVLNLAVRRDETTFDDERLNMFTTFFPRSVIVSCPPPPQNDDEYTYFYMTGTDNKRVRFRNRPVTTNTSHNYNVAFRMEIGDGTSYYQATNSDLPFGKIRPSGTNIQFANFISVSVLFCTENLSTWGLCAFVCGANNEDKITVNISLLSSQQNSFMQTFFDGLAPVVEDTDPYSGLNGESDIPGGGAVPIPDFPQLTATSTGIIGLFAPSVAQMNALASFMWTDFGGTGATELDVLKEIVEAFKRSISNPLDYVIGLNIIPSQGLSIGSSKTIRFGFISSGVSMPALSNQYFTVNCGTLHFDALCGDTFLDYAPYSKFSIYLPYIGVKEVDANDFVGHTIGVVYHGDTVTGGVTAYITKDGSVMYQYSGSCALSIPLSADGWGSTISGAVQIATSMIASGATGGAAGVAMGAAKGAASVAANPSLLSPQVFRSGAVSGGAGCMAVQKPFVIREAVRFHSTKGFNKVSGYPAFYYERLSDLAGFTTVYDAHLEGIPATHEEIKEIETLLKSGVIL